MRLEAENLAGERGGETIFAGLYFALSEGEALVVTGPNGSGKSTLLRIICGLLQPEAGKVKLSDDGTVLPVRAACHYLGHQNAMKPALSVRENLSFWQKFNGAAQARSMRRWKPSICPVWSICRSAICRRGRSAVFPSPSFWSAIVRSGSWTSRPPVSTRRRKPALQKSCAAICEKGHDRRCNAYSVGLGCSFRESGNRFPVRNCIERSIGVSTLDMAAYSGEGA